MLIDDKEEFRNRSPFRFYGYLVAGGLLPALKQREHGCDLGVRIEVCYSRAIVAHEMSGFQAPASEEPKKTNNPMNRLYRDYILYHIMGILDPGRQEEIRKEMEKTAQMPWPESVSVGCAVDEELSLPRFMTHPNMREIAKHVAKSTTTNHFFEKQKIVRILLHATHQFPFLGPLRSRILGGEFAFFLEGILGPNRALSVMNHIRRYQEWEKKN